MSGIVKCLTRNCPLQGLCYRKSALPDQRLQSYHLYEFTLEGKTAHCNHYVPAEKTKRS